MDLRTAELSDKRKIYQWLACSDITPSFMGPPDYTDLPVPTWEEFDKDYRPCYFGGGSSAEGKCYIIEDNGNEIGVVCHNELEMRAFETELDIWLQSEAVCGKGYGSRALQMLAAKLKREYGMKRFVIRPSARNKRAIASYQKAGFVPMENPPEKYRNPQELDYSDSVVLIKELN